MQCSGFPVLFWGALRGYMPTSRLRIPGSVNTFCRRPEELDSALVSLPLDLAIAAQETRVRQTNLTERFFIEYSHS